MKIWTEISELRLAENFAALQSIITAAASETALLAVVKANAYGHGIHPCARVLATAGAKWLGVTDAVEGARLRETLRSADIPDAAQPHILVMCGTAALPGEAATIVRERLTPAVWTAGHLASLRHAASAETPIPVHLEIDSGMSRQGIAPGPQLETLLGILAGFPELHLDGVFTHFASTEIAHSPQTAAQRAAFEAGLIQIAARDLHPTCVHAGNSSYIDNDDSEGWLPWLQSVALKAEARPMVRSGLALYGHLLPIEGAARPAAHANIQPVLTWKTRILAISEVQAGALIGYNGTFRATQPMSVAVLPVGYADGLRRELSSTNDRPGGWVMIRGQRAPIVGRISMNLTSVDVTTIAATMAGDEAILLGEGITAEDHARIAHTIPYEILCGIRTPCLI